MQEIDRYISRKPGDGEPRPAISRGEDEHQFKYGGLPRSTALSPDVTLCEAHTWDDVPDKFTKCDGCNSYRYKFNQISYNIGLAAARKRISEGR